MRKVLIFGNSGSGKSTLARKLCAENEMAHLDLDTLAWKDTAPPERRAIADSARDILSFIHYNQNWVIEGCYTDLLEVAASDADEIIYLDLPIETCIANARKRPWEPHKYASKADQDTNLEMLIDWIKQYTERDDTFSALAHRNFYHSYTGMKKVYSDNERIA